MPVPSGVGLGLGGFRRLLTRTFRATCSTTGDTMRSAPASPSADRETTVQPEATSRREQRPRRGSFGGAVLPRQAFESGHARSSSGWVRAGRTRTDRVTARAPHLTVPKRATPWAAVVAIGLASVFVSFAFAGPGVRSYIPSVRAERVFARCMSSLEAEVASRRPDIAAQRRAVGTSVCEALRDECSSSPYGSRCIQSLERL